MAIFLVTPLGQNIDLIGVAVRAAIVDESHRYELQNSAGWLVNFKGTSVELSHAIGITDSDPEKTPKIGSAIITTLTSYYGRGPTDMWEWLAAQFENR